MNAVATPVKHRRLSPQYVKSCRLGNDTIHKPLTKGGKKLLVESQRDPELELIVQLCARYPLGTVKNGKNVGGKPKPALEQPRDWLRLRDAYAAKNYSLVYRAAERQWAANQHLPGELVRCLYCPGKPTCSPKLHKWKDGRCLICLTGCNRCKNTGMYMCQPDLEALAYAGMLEAIRLCDFSKGGNKISTYAVWLMKQAMMPLLRQTPVFFPQELLRDRRVLAQLKKDLKCRICGGSKPHVKTCKTCDGSGKRDYTIIEAHAELAKVRKCRQTETFEERRLLAEGCYYGQEKSSVEELQEDALFRGKGEKQTFGQSRNFINTARAALSVQPHEHTEPAVEDDELRTAIEQLPAEDRRLADQWLKGRLSELPARVVARLKEEML